MDRRKIVKALGDNLQATRQAIADQPRRRHRRRQISHVRIAGPKQLVGHRLAPAIDRDGPVGALARLVMGKSGRGGDRAEQQIVFPEPSVPRLHHPVAFLVQRQPIVVAERDAPVDHRAVGPVIGVGGRRPRRVLGEFIGRRMGAGGAAQQQKIGPESVDRVNRWAGPLDHRHPGPGQGVDGVLQLAGQCVVLHAIGIGQHDADLEIAQAAARRGRQLQAPADRLLRVGAGHHLERDLQIIGRAGQGADHAQVVLGQFARPKNAARPQDVKRRLMAIDSTVMGGIADRGANVAAGFQGGQTGRQGRRRPAGGAARHAGDIPGIVGGPVNGVETLPIRQMARHIGFAEDHRAGVFETGDGQGIFGRHIVLEHRIAPGARRTGPIIGFLDGHWHAMKRPPIGAGGKRRVGGVGMRAGGGVIAPDDSVEGASMLIGAGQE